MTTGPAWVEGAELAVLLPVADAVAVLARSLAATATGTGTGRPPDPDRTVLGLAAGQLLLMPASGPDAAGAAVGVKVTSVAPGNPALGRPRVQGVYVLLDAGTLTPTLLADAAALTTLRTSALSAVAVDHLAVPDAGRLVVFGSGPQAGAHVAAVRAVRPVREVVVVGRDHARAAALADALRRGAVLGGEHLSGSGVDARVGTAGDVAGADVVVCATSAAEPLLAAGAVADHACVVAVGSHEPHRRELPGALLGRATVVVEDGATALREAGDVVLAVAEGHLDPATLVALADVVAGRVHPPVDRPRVFKSVGMAWEDLVVAAEVHRRRTVAP